jgi:hypothetical protein
MAKQPGSIWVEGDQLHYVDANGAEWYVQGEYWGPSNPSGIGANQGRPGSLWVEGDAYVHYCGAGGQDWRLPLEFTHNDAAGPTRSVPSIWIEGSYFAWGFNNGKFRAIQAHNDGTGSHTDSGHSDSHIDGSHGDFHGDGHTDTPHTDGAHSDGAHTDSHYDQHSDYNVYVHGDCQPLTNGNPSGTHQDHQDQLQGLAHCDWHDDSHADAAHGDSSHGDVAHTDSHNDQAHTDSSHGDTHYDSPHQDSTGGGTGHVDQPVYVGP